EQQPSRQKRVDRCATKDRSWSRGRQRNKYIAARHTVLAAQLPTLASELKTR
ncbi:unnamed protein product, partial [Symbiodinium sp. KB8]